MTQQYDLPPLPAYFDDFMDRTKAEIQSHVQGAIEADRQRRGRPVAYTSAIGEAAEAYFNQFKYAHKLPAQFRWEEVWTVMSGAAPQPAEPVKVPSVDILFQIVVEVAQDRLESEQYEEFMDAVFDSWEKAAEPVKAPSDDDVMSLAAKHEAHGDAWADAEYRFTEGDVLKFARALLARYGGRS